MDDWTPNWDDDEPPGPDLYGTDAMQWDSHGSKPASQQVRSPVVNSVSSKTKHVSHKTVVVTAVFAVPLAVLMTSFALGQGEDPPPPYRGDNFSTATLAADFTPPETADSDAPVYDPGEKSNTMDCAKGSESVGIHTGYVSGERRQLRLCALPIKAKSGEESIPGSRFYIRGANGRPLVSAPASYSYVRLIRAAKIRGIELSTASSFRTHEHQQELWNGSDRTGRTVAYPGRSNHQQGAAIDFWFDVGISTAQCKWRVRDGIKLCTMAGDRTYEWLHAQAHKYGLKQYYAEYWHFSPTGS